jgi:hypothetical protein
MQPGMASGMTQQHPGKPPRKRATLLCLASLALLLPAAHTQAQTGAELENLVFDAVPISVSHDAAGQRSVTELQPVPRGEAISAGAWLATDNPTPAPPQLQPNATLSQLEQQVRDLEIREGPFSEQLPQQLQALGLALQEAGELEQAQDYFQQAMHLTRVHHGLFTEAQLPHVRDSINNYLLQGELLAADEQQRYLFYLQQRNHSNDSSALLEALQAFGEWNIFAFVAPSRFPALALDGKSAVDPALFRVERLLHAQHIYWSITQLLMEKFGRQDPRLPDAEERIALTNYFFATTIALDSDAMGFSGATPAGFSAPPSLGNLGYRQGREALERRRSYLDASAVSEEERLRASLDVADWMLYFGRQRMKALDAYHEIRRDFSTRLPAEQLQTILQPAYPDTLPSFVPPSWTRAAQGLPPDLALDYHGYIDVELELNRFGRVNSLRILESSDPAASLVQQRLQRSLRRTQFRPRFNAQGQLLPEDRLQVRYYYSW